MSDSAANAAGTAARIHRIRERDRERLLDADGQKNDLVRLDRLYRQPIVNGAWVERELDVAKATANKMLARMRARASCGRRRASAHRLIRYDECVDVFHVPATW